MGIQTDDLAASTITERRPQVFEQISKNSGLYDHLMKKGRKRDHKGGTRIEVDLIFRETNGFKYFKGNEALSTDSTQNLSSAVYDIKQAAIPIVMTDIEEVLNKGDAKKVDIEASRIEAAEITMKNNIGVTGLYSLGLADNGKQIGGLQHIISTSPTSGIVGDIDRSISTNAAWRNQVLAEGGAKSTSTFKQKLGRLSRSCTVSGYGSPDLYVADNLDFEIFETIADSRQYITKEVGEVGYQMLQFNGKPFIYDGGLGGACPANTTFALNLDTFDWVVVPGRDFDSMKKKHPVNQLISVLYYVFYGNLVNKAPRLNGVYTV